MSSSMLLVGLPPAPSAMVEPLPVYSRRDPETSSIRSSAPSYVSEAPTYHSTYPGSGSGGGPAATPRRGLPPTNYAPGFHRAPSGKPGSLSHLRFDISEWSSARSGPQARHYHNVASRRASVAVAEAETARLTEELAARLSWPGPGRATTSTATRGLSTTTAAATAAAAATTTVAEEDEEEVASPRTLAGTWSMIDAADPGYRGPPPPSRGAVSPPSSSAAGSSSAGGSATTATARDSTTTATTRSPEQRPSLQGPAAAAASAPGGTTVNPTTPVLPLEDPDLVGAEAAAVARERRLCLQRIVAGEREARRQECASWDFMLYQMADWKERERSWERFRRDAQAVKGLGRLWRRSSK